MMLFTLSIFLSWVMRDYAQPLMKKIPWIAHITGEPSDEWFGKQAVYRISFGNFLFFALWSVLLVGVKYKKEARAKLHTDGWFLKLILWVAMNVFPFFLPNESMEVYSMFSRFGSGFFLVIQMMLLLDFTHAWNDSWVSKEHYGWVAGLLTMTTACYGLCVAGVVVMYEFFDPAGEGEFLGVMRLTPDTAVEFEKDRLRIRTGGESLLLREDNAAGAPKTLALWQQRVAEHVRELVPTLVEAALPNGAAVLDDRDL